MLRRTQINCNTHLVRQRVVHPASVIRSGTAYWNDPERVIKNKLLFFTLGLDQQALRRSAIIARDAERQRAIPREGFKKDVTGFRRARHRQSVMWNRRIRYQAYFLEHMFTRHAWGLIRKYPSMGTKIPSAAEDGYFGTSRSGMHQLTHEPLPALARTIYPPRK